MTHAPSADAPVAERRDARTIRVALYAGVAFRSDAVSRSFLLKLDLLSAMAGAGYPIEVTGFTQASDYDHPSIVVVPSITALMRHPAFAAADLHVFEYAMWYELFNALLLVDVPVLVVDHNTTPAELVDVAEVREACERACLERNNLSLATRVATVGEFTRDQLVAQGVDPARVSVMHLPAANPFVGRRRHRFTAEHPDGAVEVLFVGRLVRAKGIEELLAAAESLWAADPGGFHLTLAGSLRFSDAQTVVAIEASRARHQSDGRLSVVLDAADEEIAQLFGQADVLVMPSHHEGYCVPVVEAMTSGCFVIGSDAGNLPNVMGGLGSSFTAGDVGELTEALATFVARVRSSRTAATELVLPASDGDMRLGDWHDAVARHLQDYSVVRFQQVFLGLLGQLLEDGHAVVPQRLGRLLSHPDELQPAL